VVSLFGNNRGSGVLMVAANGVPLYVCGAILFLAGWLSSGMIMVAATTFMIIGLATKNANLEALKLVLGSMFAMAVAGLAGVLVDLFI